MNLKYLVVTLLILLLFVGSVNTVSHAQSSVVYPTISYHTFTGYNNTITDTEWLSVVYPIIYSANFSTYNWNDSPLKNYILFDYSLTGLNPYGAEFIEALETIGNFTSANVTLAFKQIANLDATGDGYTNQQKLDAGALPGFYNSTPGSFSIPTTRSTYGYIFGGAVIASVIILYFVFNRKKNE